MEKKYKNSFKATFIICACILILKTIDINQIGKLFSSISIFYFSIAVAVCIIDKVIMGIKWNILLKAFNINVPMSVPVISNLRAKVFHFFSPTTIGEDVYKIYYLKKCGAPVISIVSSIFVERVIGAYSSLAIISLLIHFALLGIEVSYTNLITILGGFTFIGLTIFLYSLIGYSDRLKDVSKVRFLPEKIRNSFNEFLQALSSVKENKKNIIYYYFCSIGEKVFYGSAIYFSAKSLGILNIDYLYIISAAPLLALLERLPISISAIGVREGLFVVLFNPYFDDPTISITVAIILRIAEVVMTIFCLFLWFGKHDGESYENRIDYLNKEITELKIDKFGS